MIRIMMMMTMLRRWFLFVVLHRPCITHNSEYRITVWLPAEAIVFETDVQVMAISEPCVPSISASSKRKWHPASWDGIKPGNSDCEGSLFTRHLQRKVKYPVENKLVFFLLLFVFMASECKYQVRQLLPVQKGIVFYDTDFLPFFYSLPSTKYSVC